MKIICFYILFITLALTSIRCSDQPILITELDEHIFPSVVGMDRFVWAIKIGSKMCEGCKEFYPEFVKLSQEFTHIKYGIVYVENPVGMKLVKKFKGVMNKGLPAVILLKDQDPYKFQQLVFGQFVKAQDLKKSIIKEVKDLVYTTGLYKRIPGGYENHEHDDL